MPVISIIFGLLLAGLGAYCYSAANPEYKSFTATIPAWPGVLLIICGAIALKESLLKHAMHAAATVGLLGFLAGAINWTRVLISGGEWTGNKSVASGGMALLCAVFVTLCINSFIQARRRQAARTASQG